MGALRIAGLAIVVLWMAFLTLRVEMAVAEAKWACLMAYKAGPAQPGGADTACAEFRFTPRAEENSN